VDITPVSIVEIVIARYEVKLIKRSRQFFQIAQTELQSLHVDTGSVVIPIA
jgi:hypothetical protein